MTTDPVLASALTEYQALNPDQHFGIDQLATYLSGFFNLYASMVCDREGHMIPHSPCCSEQTDTTPHDYLSTGCLHGDLTLPDGRTGHEYCQGDTGHAGTKQPGQCKFCAAPCRCDCHTN